MESLLSTFYKALAEGNLETLTTCYSKKNQFSDPAFGDLQGPQIMDIWTFLLSKGGENLQVETEVIYEESLSAAGQWGAKYPFGSKKRPVTNGITATFVIEDRKIVTHHDVFDLWKWSSQALGLPGMLMGWSPWFATKLRGKFRKTLFTKSNG